MTAIHRIHKENFESEILKSEQKVLLDFWAPWCGPCRMLSPLLEELAAERPDVKIAKVNVDEEPELAARYGVMSVPTLLVMEAGQVQKQVVGARPKKSLLELL